MIYFFIGTTAELIKVMPAVLAVKRKNVPYKIISSGQNKFSLSEMKPLFGDIKIDIPFEFKTESHKASFIYFLYWTVHTFFDALFGLRSEFRGLDRKSSYLVVHGDTVSSLLGSIIGVIYRIPVAHVESGLRSFNFLEPFPEEFCRFVVSKVSSLHFSPNSWAMKNLKGTKGKKVNTKMNVVVETLFKALSVTKNTSLPLTLKNKKFFLLMMHRQEHVMFQKNKSKETFMEVINNIPKNMYCLIILHSLTEAFLKSQNIYEQVLSHPQVITLPRQRYPLFAKIMDNCEFMISDGGSTQEEAYFLGKPCLIMRNVTERTEGLGENAILLKGELPLIKKFIKTYKQYKRKKVKITTPPSEIVAAKLI